MREIIEMLLDIEAAASRAYEKAAAAFEGDEAFCSLLKRLSADEKNHYDALVCADEYLGENDTPPVIAVDAESKEKIYGLLRSCEEKLDAGGLTRAEILDFMVSIEYSEWNNIFLYVINTMRKRHREFVPEAVDIQRHKRVVERYIKSLPGHEALYEKLRSLEPLWVEKILVVGSENVILDVLSALLTDEGLIETAANGDEALEMLSKTYYAVIIADMEIPAADGMDLYARAVRSFDGIGERFIFISGVLDEGREGFLRENGLKWLGKPFSISAVRTAVAGILGKRAG